MAIEGIKVTVIMPFYNCEKFLDEAITSILDQLFTDFEFIIINDASTDQSEKIVNKYLHDGRIRYIKNASNQGIVHNLNLGILMSRGKYIARMDGDDISHPERLMAQYKFMLDNKDIGLVGTFFNVIDHYGKEIQRTKKPILPEVIKKDMFKYPTIGVHGSTFYKKTIIEKLGGYRKNYGTDHGQDIDLFYRYVYSGYKASNIPKFLYSYRVHMHSSSNKANILAWKNYKLRKEMIAKYNLELKFSDRVFMYMQLLIGLILSGRQKQKFEQIFKKFLVDHA